jgi:hypothetical protein
MFKYDIHSLISLGIDPSDGLPWFENLNDLTSHGMGFSLRKDLGKGAYGIIGYSYARVMDIRSGRSLASSPENKADASVVFPVFNDNTSLATQLDYVDQMRALSGKYTSSFTILNLTLTTSDFIWGTEMSLAVKNALDVQYSVPATDIQSLNTVPMDGRNFTIKLAKEF